MSTLQTPRRIGSRIEHLASVDGMIAYDLDTARVSGGGTRLATDLTETEMRLLARAMTYKLAILELPIGGAKIGLRASAEERDGVIARFRAEIAPLLVSGTLMTGPDLGTHERDFAGLPTPGEPAGIAAIRVDGTPAEELLTGRGVVAALDAALSGGLEGRMVALEGFGKMGASIARSLETRGGRVVAVSTIEGCAIARPGRSFSLDQLLEARNQAGDALVHRLRVDVRPREALWGVTCDALVPGARPGVLDGQRARRVLAPVIVPVANAPYTRLGLRTLRLRGIAAHADFITSAGGAMAYLSPQVAQADGLDRALSAVDRLMAAMVQETMNTAVGPYASGVALAERFLRTWLPAGSVADGPPLPDGSTAS